jgi:hypothetical protein
MKFHNTTIERLLKIYENYGGYREETRLRAALHALELEVYDQQSTGKKVVVLASEAAKHKK